MSQRRPLQSALLFVMTVVLTPPLCSAQAGASSRGAGWSPPRTSWGAPDLQGVWGNATITPFERPAAMADKAFLTEEEAAAAERQRAETAANNNRAGSAPNEPPPVGGNVGAYNYHWLDLGTRVVRTRRTSLVVDPEDGLVPVRPEAEAKRQFNLRHSTDSYEYMSIWDRCITRGIPAGMFPAGYNNYYRIVQTPGYVVIVYEMIHDARIIPVHAPSTPEQSSPGQSSPQHMDDSVRFWNGDPIGRWEGDTLVVETTNFTDKSWIATSASQRRIKGIAQSAEARIIERFTRIDEHTIDWSVRIDDPEVYTSPWTVDLPLVATPEYRIYEYACHEGNQAVGNILRGARVQEQLAGEDGR